jgi:hypothetical protein
VDTFDVSLEKQQVVVKGSADYNTVLEKIKKTGKEVKSGEIVSWRRELNRYDLLEKLRGIWGDIVLKVTSILYIINPK